MRPGEQHQQRHHRQDRHVHGQDVEIIGHVDQGIQTKEGLLGVLEKKIQIHQADVIDAGVQEAVARRAQRCEDEKQPQVAGV